jgi:hypothetical protein
MTSELNGAIADARQALDADPRGHLPLPWRRQIRATFGPLGDDRAAPGWMRRWRLALRCVDRALPRWRSEHPDDRRPEQLVELARAVFAGEVEPADAATQCSFFLHEILYAPDRFSPHAYFAGNAAAALVRIAALGDYGAELAADTIDEDLEPEGWDAEALAAAAEASFPGDPNDDPARRRAFWLWYLDEAVPAAFAGDGQRPVMT